MKPRKRFGQHFLRNSAAVGLAVAHAGISPGDVLIEVGSGKGVLTDALLRFDNPLTAVEVDRDLSVFLSTRFSGNPQLTIHNRDILTMDWNTTLFPDRATSYKMISNLPYNISSPFLMKLLYHRTRIKKTVLMLQQEFADRIMGDHHLKKKQYGSLSVLFSLFFERHKIMTVPPESFYPVPKVHSVLISLTAKNMSMPDEVGFASFVRDCFIFKRKYFSKSLERYLHKANLPIRRAERVKKYLTLRPDNISATDYATIYALIHST